MAKNVEQAVRRSIEAKAAASDAAEPPRSLSTGFRKQFTAAEKAGIDIERSAMRQRLLSAD